MPEDIGPLGQIVEEADRLSAAADLTGGVTREIPVARVLPLHERLVTGLRYLIDRGTLPFNRPGAAGWLVGEDLWLVVKTALDALRAHLLQEGQTGIPSDNRRLMDELQQGSVLIPNGDRAIWSARITLGEWQQDLTLLRFSAARLWPDSAIRPDTCHGTIQPLAGTHIEEGFETPAAPSQSVMDEPPTRLTSPARTITEAAASTKPTDLGQAFLAWLKQGLLSGVLPINTVNARVHRVNEGLLLVSPGIFRDYGNAAQAPWTSIQKRFQKLRVHRKTPDGFNIWTYTVMGGRGTGELSGLLIEAPEKVFGPSVTLPPPNVHVILVQGSKG